MKGQYFGFIAIGKMGINLGELIFTINEILMVENQWLEQPPKATDRKKLAED
jgi:hypothetical protein